MKLLILGCGLLGCSVAMAARAAGAAKSIVGFDPDAASVASARQLDAFDSVSLLHDPADLSKADWPNADIAVVAGPPSSLADGVERLAAVAELVLDVGSVKVPVLSALEERGRVPAHFVPCHPMAGSHLAGGLAAQANLFRDRWVFVAAEATTDPAAQARAHEFWRALGARTTDLSPAEHDAAVAYTSHLPHLLAAVYAGLADVVPAAAGPGFRDFSRLARANPALWADILRTNRGHILPLVEKLQEALTEARALLAQHEPTDAASQDRLLDYLAARKAELDQLDQTDRAQGRRRTDHIEHNAKDGQ